MSTSRENGAERARLAELLQMSDDKDRVWRPEELGAILQHQLAVPMEYDLTGVDVGKARRLKTNAAAKGLLLRSFGDLLHHPHPPVELLKMTKRFAKASRNQPDSSLPSDIATLLYFACIAVALVRCQRRITDLDISALREGFQWGREQSWVDKATAALFDGGLRVLNNAGGASYE